MNTCTAGMPPTLDMNALATSAQAACAAIGGASATAVAVLGSGWGALVEALPVVATLNYTDIPCLGAPGVKGHRGALHRCRLDGKDILIFQGRRHWYEGQGWTPVAFPVYLARQVRAPMLLLTNAAGAINTAMAPGELMLIDDHINLLGANPLIGPHAPFWGARFPDQTEVYDAGLRELLANTAAQHPVTMHRGVYLAASGPVYETPAEIRAYRAWGADAVGMSTVPEAMLGHAAGMRVAALSCITNYAAGVCQQQLKHDDVLAVTRDRMPAMAAMVRDFLAVCGAGPTAN
jgi:purine-nucleoside phosphorylase